MTTSPDNDWTEITHKNLKTWGVVVKKDDKVVGSYELEDTVTYIGRMPENHIVLDDPLISRSHAKVTCVGGQYLLEDQQSENGLIVNREKVPKKWLQLKDQIVMGNFLLEVTDQLGPHARKKEITNSKGLDDRTISVQTDEIT